LLRELLRAHKTPDWTDVRDKYLPALALDIAPNSDAVTNADRLRVALIAPQLGSTARTVTELLDRVVADELGLGAGPVTMDRIRAHLLARRAGIEPRGKARDMVGSLAANRVKAARGTLKDLRAALGRSWAMADRPTTASSTNPTTTRLAPPGDASTGTNAARPASTAELVSTHPIDEESFAHLVEDAAHSVGPDGRYGPQKVFIAAIWDELSSRLDISFEELKQRLLDANRLGFLSLARADLVGAMDPAVVARSEIADANASFHFVIDSGRR
jgi:hypothetical protein